MEKNATSPEDAGRRCSGISQILFNYFISALSFWFMYRLARGLYNLGDPPIKKRVLFIAGGCLYLGSVVTFIGHNNNDQTPYLIIFCIALLYLTLDLKIVHCFVAVGLFYILMGLGDFISYLLFTQLLHYDVSYVQSHIPLSLACHLIGFAFIFLFLLIIKKRYFQYGFQNLRRLPFDLNTMLYITAALTLIFINFIFIFNADNEAYRISVIYSSLFFSFLILGLVFVVISNRLKVEQRKNQQLKLYIETIGELSDELRRFKHNYLNILHGLSGFAELGDWGRLRDYIDDLVSEGKKLKKNNIVSLQKINEPGLYGLLSSKISTAESAGIEVDLHIEGAIEETLIKNFELYEVLGIYMDNAIEAVEKLGQKRIGIEMAREDGHVKINVTNNIEATTVPVTDLYKKGYSTKGEGRGSGLWLAQEILSRYRGVLYNTVVEDQLFVQEIIAPLKKKEEKNDQKKQG